mmetsp:Transcript_7037/g.16015  ORF Transcript_7037/g.16015 Transcript_7037/m.16015 type:complete len:82 (+) Transcript_7037:584-829(+)
MQPEHEFSQSLLHSKYKQSKQNVASHLMQYLTVIPVIIAAMATMCKNTFLTHSSHIKPLPQHKRSLTIMPQLSSSQKQSSH